MKHEQPFGARIAATWQELVEHMNVLEDPEHDDDESPNPSAVTGQEQASS